MARHGGAGGGHGGHGGVAVPVAVGSSGGGVARGEHQHGRAVPTCVKAQPGAAWALLAACGGDWRPWRVGARARGRGRGVGGSGSMERLRERSELGLRAR